MSNPSYLQIAQYIIRKSNERGTPFSMLKLQRYLYLAQAWWLGNGNVPLFEEDFEAWVHGPIIRSLFYEHQNSRWSPLPDLGEPDLVRDVSDFLDELLESHKGFDIFALEAKVKDHPWEIARTGYQSTQGCSTTINKENIRRHYQWLLSEPEYITQDKHGQEASHG